jgi:hypothetical protein
MQAAEDVSSKEGGEMSQVALMNQGLVVSGRALPSRNWAGTLARTSERATHYLHLMAFPCEKCEGPVVAGWIGKRKDDITRETEITGLGTICLSCGSRPEALIDPLAARHFRPVEWEWIADKKPEAIEPDGDPLASELSQDADSNNNSPGFSEKSQM